MKATAGGLFLAGIIVVLAPFLLWGRPSGVIIGLFLMVLGFVSAQSDRDK